MQVFVNECYNIEDEANSCYLHPDETFVGVCPLCLNERLIILASLSKSSMYCLHRRSFNFCCEENSFFSFGQQNKKPALKKIFSLGSGIFRGQHKSGDHFPGRDRDLDETASTSSQEDSYISFKIEENGSASWEKNKNAGGTKQSDNKTVEDSRKGTEAEHGKHNIQKKNATELSNPKTKQTKRPNWHNRIGQLIRKKGSMRGWVCQVSIDKVVEGVEIRKGGWIKRTLTKRRESKKG
ncbi:unnamed protein product [Rhodiola kirilowii]